jgi:hypothetical protein
MICAATTSSPHGWRGAPGPRGRCRPSSSRGPCGGSEGPCRSPGSVAFRTLLTCISESSITAGVCAFSTTSRITQRDGTTWRDAPGSRTLLYPGDPGPHRPTPPRGSRASGRLPEPRLTP